MDKIQEINSLKMELKLSQDILEIEIQSGREKVEAKSVLHRERVEKLVGENEGLREEVGVLRRNLRAIAGGKKEEEGVECRSIGTSGGLSCREGEQGEEREYVESVCFDVNGERRETSHYLRQIDDLHLRESRYQAEIQGLKETISYL